MSSWPKNASDNNILPPGHSACAPANYVSPFATKTNYVSPFATKIKSRDFFTNVSCNYGTFTLISSYRPLPLLEAGTCLTRQQGSFQKQLMCFLKYVL